jgi:hypothetical protein
LPPVGLRAGRGRRSNLPVPPSVSSWPDNPA